MVKLCSCYSNTIAVWRQPYEKLPHFQSNGEPPIGSPLLIISSDSGKTE